MTPTPRPVAAYVKRIVSSYLQLPHTPTRARPLDRQLAAQLHRRGVPIDFVEAAFLLATTRRFARPSDADPLPTIRSLHYFLPVIDELLQNPPPHSYFTYLRRSVDALLHQPGPDKGPKKDVFT